KRALLGNFLSLLGLELTNDIHSHSLNSFHAGHTGHGRLDGQVILRKSRATYTKCTAVSRRSRQLFRVECGGGRRPDHCRRPEKHFLFSPPYATWLGQRPPDHPFPMEK